MSVVNLDNSGWVRYDRARKKENDEQMARIMADEENVAEALRDHLHGHIKGI